MRSIPEGIRTTDHCQLTTPPAKLDGEFYGALPLELPAKAGSSRILQSVMASPCQLPFTGEPLRFHKPSANRRCGRTRNARPYLFTIHDYLFTHKKEPIRFHRSVLFCVGVTYLPV